MSEDHELQKELATAKMAQILGSHIKAQNWLKTYQEEFQGRSAEEMIDQGFYEEVLNMIGRIEGRVY